MKSGISSVCTCPRDDIKENKEGRALSNVFKNDRSDFKIEKSVISDQNLEVKQVSFNT